MDNAQNAYVSYAAGGSSTACSGGSPGGVYRVGPNGSTTLVAGGGTASGEGIAAMGAALSMSISKLLFDPAGNLYVVERMSHKIRRVEAAAGRISTVAGTGAFGFAGELTDAKLAQLNWPWAAVFDANRNLLVADTSNAAVRTIWASGSTTSSPATLEVTSVDPQTVVVDQVTAPLSVLLRDGAGQPIAGYPVSWSAIDPGGGLLTASSVTDLSGVASSAARAGLLPGAYRFSASTTPFGTALQPASATLTVNATAPAAGSMFSVVGVEHLAGATGIPGAATLARVSSPTGLAAAKDGTLYFAGSDNNSTNPNHNYHQIFALSPAGALSVVAGTGTCGHTGDGGPASAALLCNPLDLVLDETNLRKSLYVVDGSLIRAIDLTKPIPTISTLAGGASPAVPGPGYGDDNPAPFATLNSPQHIALDPGGAFLYIVDNGANRFRRVNLSTGYISAWLSVPAGVICYNSNCSGTSHDCNIGFDPQGTTYIKYDPFNSNPSCTGGTGTGAVFRLNADNSTTLVAGGGTAVGEGISAVGAALSPVVSQMTFDAAKALYLVERTTHRVRKVSDLTGTASATISTVVGTGTAGNGADWLSPTGTALSSPWGLAVLPDGKLVLSDTGNHTLRAIWPPFP